MEQRLKKFIIELIQANNSIRLNFIYKIYWEVLRGKNEIHQKKKKLSV